MKSAIAILDDFQGVALEMADWDALREHFRVAVFRDNVAAKPAVIERLRPFEIIVAMRERTPFPRSLIERLPNLRLLVTTGMWNRAIDMEAAARQGIVVCGTDSSKHAPVELTWALILGLARQLAQEDEADAIKKTLDSQRQDAEKVLKEIRDVAAEQGVSQQANYFRNAADQHDAESEKWRTLTIRLVFLLGVYALLSLVIHKIPFLHPETTYEAIQISISKVLIFAVISFMLYLAARNFLAHKHNAIVNRHRQNALLTYKALLEGSSDKAISDAVQMYVASCIYGPQPTGYTSNEHGEAAGEKSVIELLSKPIAK